jgi:hypothetical protein
MPKHSFAAPLLLLALSGGPAVARDLAVEVEVVHVAGKSDVAQLDAMLADERLSIEAAYEPTQLIPGETARRERVMPIGSRLFAIGQTLSLTGAQVERRGRLLRFRLPHVHPEHAEYYRLGPVELRAPAAAARGRPQTESRFHLIQVPPKAGAHEIPLLTRLGAFDVGLRVRYRWSDAQDEAFVVDLAKCHADIQALGNGRYRFRVRHRLIDQFRGLASTVQSDPPSRPPAGQRSFRMRAPYPEPMADWQMSRNHLVQLKINGQTVERLSIYAQQRGGGHCRRARTYEALFVDGHPVAVSRSIREDECSAEGSRQSHGVDAEWLDDGTLDSYLVGTLEDTVKWDAFLAAEGCGSAAAPPASEVEALKDELQRIRQAFLRP